MTSMFAPHCPTCQRRVLLGTRRIVAADLAQRGAFRVMLRCHCGTLVHHGDPPAAVPAPPPASNAA
jgi:hypothetical protein